MREALTVGTPGEFAREARRPPRILQVLRFLVGEVPQPLHGGIADLAPDSLDPVTGATSPFSSTFPTGCSPSPGRAEGRSAASRAGAQARAQIRRGVPRVPTTRAAVSAATATVGEAPFAGGNSFHARGIGPCVPEPLKIFIKMPIRLLETRERRFGGNLPRGAGAEYQ